MKLKSAQVRTIYRNGHRRSQASVLRVRRRLVPKLAFEADVDEPQTIASLAAQQRRFLADNMQEWVDVELPSRL